jgi:hypothetical protein
VAQVRRGFPSKRRHIGIQAEPEVPQLNRAQQISLERFSLGWPWHDAKKAAALARELIQWAMPKQVWVEPDDPRVAVLDAQLGAEAPIGGDPYRMLGDTRVCVDPPEVTDARFEIANICAMLSAYVDGEPVPVPKDFDAINDHPMTRLYWYATEAGKRAVALTLRAAMVVTASQPVEDSDRWRATGNAAQEACEFLRKHATNNPTIGMLDGAGGGVLHRISLALAYAGKPTEEITGRMFHWRVKDALKGKELSPELDANLRPAFEAAWSAGEYEFAYSLLEDLDQLTELP